MSWQSIVLNQIFRLRKRRIVKTDPRAIKAGYNKLEEKTEKTLKIPTTTEHRVDTLNGVPCEWMIAEGAKDSDQLVLYFHGGGFMLGSPPILHRPLAARLSAKSGRKVLLVDYRLTPAHTYPAPVEDCSQVYQWLLDNGYNANQIAFGGDSAGGNLVLSVIQSAREQSLPLPALGICLSPWADLTHTGSSIQSNKHRDPMLPVEILELMALIYGKGHNLAEPKISLVFADFSGFPPLLVYAGTTEILLSDAERVVAAAEAKGVTVESKYWHKQAHAFPVMTQYLPEAREAVDGMADFINRHMR